MGLKVGILSTSVQSSFVSKIIIEKELRMGLAAHIEWHKLNINAGFMFQNILAMKENQRQMLTMIGEMLYKQSQKYDLDYIYIDDYQLIPLVFLARDISKQEFKVFFIAHSILVNNWLYYWLLSAPLLRKSDFIWVTSQYSNSLLKGIHKNLGDSKAIPLMLSEEYLSSLEAFENEALDEDEYLLYLGRIVKEKGVYNGLKAFCSLADRYPKLKLKIAGPYNTDDEFYLSLVRFIETNGIKDKVEFVGRVEDHEKVKLIKGAKALMYLSNAIAETFGYVIIEALAAGTPVIATKWSAFREIIKDGHNGYLIDNNIDENDLNEKVAVVIEQLLRSEEHLAKLSANAIESAKKYHSAYVSTEIYDNLGEALNTEVYETLDEKNILNKKLVISEMGYGKCISDHLGNVEYQELFGSYIDYLKGDDTGIINFKELRKEILFSKCHEAD